MSITLTMKDIIRKELDDREKQSKASSQKVTFVVSTSDAWYTTKVAQISLKLSKPVPENEMKGRSSGILKHVAESLGNHNLGIVDNLLAQYGMKGKVGKKRTVGAVKVHLGSHEEGGRSVGVQTTKGKLISQTNLKSLLELLGKNYLIRDMKKPGAPLKFRTGRFANSMKVRSATIDDNDTGKPELNVLYSYKQYPYATFDPQKSSRPAMYMNPSFGARNPQKNIGEALAKAARDLIHTRYKINVKEARE